MKTEPKDDTITPNRPRRAPNKEALFQTTELQMWWYKDGSRCHIFKDLLQMLAVIEATEGQTKWHQKGQSTKILVLIQVKEVRQQIYLFHVR